MPPSSRPLVGYRSFPPEFLTLLERIEELQGTETLPVGPLSKSEALSARRAFYRFRNSLHEAENDPYARQMAAIATNVAATFQQSVDFSGKPIWYIHFGFQPIVLALRASLAPHRPLRDRLPPPSAGREEDDPQAFGLPNREDPYA